MAKDYNSTICNICVGAMNVGYFLTSSNTSFKVARTVAYYLCRLFEISDLCTNAMEILAPPFYFNFFSKGFNPLRNCGRISLCPWDYTKENTTDVINKIIKGKPRKQPVIINDSIPYMKFLVFNVQVYGHTHYDNIQIVRGIKDPNEITGIVYIAPQLGTHTNANPSFRVFDIQSDNYAVVNYRQYRLYLKEAQSTNVPYWRLAYSFKDLYNCTDMRYETIAKAVSRVDTDMEFVKQLINQMYQEGPEAQEVMENANAQIYLHCMINYSLFDEIYKCLGRRFLKFSEWGYMELNRVMFPKGWETPAVKNITNCT